MRLLGLDVGMRHTGVALADSTADILMAKETIEHLSEDELIIAVQRVIVETQAEKVILGLPFLPQGDEGEQVRYVRRVGNRIEKELGISVSFVDERYSSVSSSVCGDGHAMAACTILGIALDQLKKCN